MSAPAGTIASACGLAALSAPIGLAAASGARSSEDWERGAAGLEIAPCAGCCGLAASASVRVLAL
jgi:hypothetical protein